MGQTIHIISKVNPLRLLMTKPSSLNGRLAKRLHCSHNTRHNSCHRKLQKDKPVAGLLAKYPNSRTTKLYEDLPDEITKVYMT